MHGFFLRREELKTIGKTGLGFFFFFFFPKQCWICESRTRKDREKERDTECES